MPLANWRSSDQHQGSGVVTHRVLLEAKGIIIHRPERVFRVSPEPSAGSFPAPIERQPITTSACHGEGVRSLVTQPGYLAFVCIEFMINGATRERVAIWCKLMKMFWSGYNRC